ncbi:TPA: hypothetical protein MFG21_001374 [Klebsiella pneumoniae]|nr:hypothetical protein [Klebsiella pneumoniae]
MKNTKLDLMERYLIILDKFASKISESGVPQQKVIEQSYLFCSGFYIKYKQEIEKIKFSNSDVVLTFLLYSYYKFINKLDDDLIDKRRIRKICSLLINFIVDNGSQSEKVYVQEKKKYDAFQLQRDLSMKNKRKKYGL